MLSQSFNRYRWDVQRVTDRTHQLDRDRTDLPSRSVINFRSVRSENIGQLYSRLVYLMTRLSTFQGASPSDKKHQVRQVLKKLKVIGPNWVDEHKDLLDTPGGFNFSRVTWKRIVDFAGDFEVVVAGRAFPFKNCGKMEWQERRDVSSCHIGHVRQSLLFLLPTGKFISSYSYKVSSHGILSPPLSRASDLGPCLRRLGRPPDQRMGAVSSPCSRSHRPPDT